MSTAIDAGKGASVGSDGRGDVTMAGAPAPDLDISFPEPQPMSDPTAAIVDTVRDARGARNGLAVAAALNAVRPEDLAGYFHTSLAGDVAADAITEGLPASPGVAAGAIVLDAEAAVAAADEGRSVILVRPETSPDDVLGMQAAAGILTIRGGLVSHAAVVARGWGIPAVVGAGEVHVDETGLTVGDVRLGVGEEITIDGSTGLVYAGRLATAGSEAPAELDTLLAWADTVAEGSVQVRVNADTEGDASHGRDLGAKGIGLCRTEHMFLAHDRLPIVRRFILAHDAETEARALAELEEVQIVDFERLLEAMNELPVTIRLLDPPLHEFLPDLGELIAAEARGELDAAGETELAAVRRLHEANPMIGTRGVRLGVVRSGLYQMQVHALCTAAANLFDRGLQPRVEIMIPLVVDAEELRLARSWVTDVLDELGHPELASTLVTVGAMIETPRAALTAAALAEHADFFSFGTNDLTQMTYAFSRDDVEAKLLPAYQAAGILPANPFAVLDQEGVGRLVQLGCEGSRRTKPQIKLGACGEHAGHPASADFLVRLGLDSVSCSPFRVPMARLGVAQALLACGRVHINDIEFDFDHGAAETSATSATGGAETPSSGLGAATFEITEALVLHVLRIRGFVTGAGFEASLGTVPADIVASLAEAGLVRHLEARDMYQLLPEGKERHLEILPGLATDAVRGGLERPYEDFLTLNLVFKELCTGWQMRDGEPNDHSDAAYDDACRQKLAGFHAEAVPVIRSMGEILPRMLRYETRLAEAADGVTNGLDNRFTGVMCESYHDIWMEFHEDLVVLQGIDRVKEGSF